MDGMTFLQSVEKRRYDSFVAAHEQKSHFMQSVAWGEFCMAERGLKPHYVGMEDEAGALAAAALLLERKPLGFPPYFYSPRGFVIDFFDETLLALFTAEVAAFCKKRGAMFLKIDPDIELREIDKNAEPVPGGADNSSLIGELARLGFTHLGFNKGFEGRQPRYTFRLDLLPEQAAILSRIEGNVLKNVRKCETNYVTEVYEGDDTDTLYELITGTSERGSFFAYSKSFYRNFYSILSSYGMAALYFGKVYTKQTAESLRHQLAAVTEKRSAYKKERRLNEAALTERRLQREAELFEAYAEKYGDEAVISAHLTVRYGKHAWAVHAGSSNDMKETFLNNRVYLHKILEQKAHGAQWFDLFGTVGNPSEGPLKTLHEFKRQFGGRYIEFIGEFDMVFKPGWYRLYTGALPRYRALLFDFRAALRKIAGMKKTGVTSGGVLQRGK